MNKVLVVGGGGFIGSYVCEELIRKGFNVTALDRVRGKYDQYLEELGVKFQYGSFVEGAVIKESISCGIDILIHLASTTVPLNSNENPNFDVETNLLGTLNMLNYAYSSGIKRFIFSSSGGTVYGNNSTSLITEDSSTKPTCSYGIVKLSIENYLEMYKNLHNLNYTILRISNAYGPRQPLRQNQGLIPMVVNKLLSNEHIDIWGDGEAVRDYVYVKDVASAFVVATQEMAANEIFNIGSGLGHSTNQVIGLISHTLKKKARVNYIGNMNAGVSRNILDYHKAKSLLGWNPTVSLEKGLHEYIQSLIT